MSGSVRGSVPGSARGSNQGKAQTSVPNEPEPPLSPASEYSDSNAMDDYEEFATNLEAEAALREAAWHAGDCARTEPCALPTRSVLHSSEPPSQNVVETYSSQHLAEDDN